MDEARRLEYLAEHGIGIVRLLPSTNGALVECLEIDGLPHGPALCIKRRARRRSLNSGIPRCVKTLVGARGHGWIPRRIPES
ncbi:MAG: hypothetical protein VX893_16590 [Candidatus Latescibacterota bacterium]|nr:hypothetical protein [Candidatus Latescibacterota bacterium]